jgi:hypothetical protein
VVALGGAPSFREARKVAGRQQLKGTPAPAISQVLIPMGESVVKSEFLIGCAVTGSRIARSALSRCFCGLSMRSGRNAGYEHFPIQESVNESNNEEKPNA